MVRVSIAVDAMGGDFAPEEIVRGAYEAAEARRDVDIILVGREDSVKLQIRDLPRLENLRVINAEEIVGMDEEPAKAVRSKRNSSVVIGCKLVKEGVADGFVSAGNSGAVLAAALFILGRAQGIDRPAIAVVVPGYHGRTLLLDAGANTEIKPKHFLEFATVGDAFMRRAYGVENPKIGLVSIGAEEGKGTTAVKAAYDLLAASSLNFAGNIEGHDIPLGNVQVAVCDGFVGNVILKTLEGTAEAVLQRFKEAVSGSLQSKVGGMLLLPALADLKKDVDPEEHGGALLLGVDGVCLIAHGKSSARALRNAVLRAVRAVETKVVEGIVRSLRGDKPTE